MRSSFLWRFLTYFLFGAVWFHNREPLGPDTPGIILLYEVLYSWHVLAMSAAAAAASSCYSVCCYTAVVAAAAAAVRHRVLDGKNCCWFIGSDSIQCFLSLQSNTIYV